MESVTIQQFRDHNILNSRSEYNRCSIPRLSTRLGDREFKLYEKEIEKEKEKEEALARRIKEMRKARNKQRKPRNQESEPATKRRKTGPQTSENVTASWSPNLTGPEYQEFSMGSKNEKRKVTLTGPANKRQKTKQTDIRKYIGDQAEQSTPEEEGIYHSQQQYQAELCTTQPTNITNTGQAEHCTNTVHIIGRAELCTTGKDETDRAEPENITLVGEEQQLGRAEHCTTGHAAVRRSQAEHWTMDQPEQQPAEVNIINAACSLPGETQTIRHYTGDCREVSNQSI